MANTIDQMQDVFPVSFEFVKGEQPSATKLTGWVKQTNTAFARMTKAVGDPWEYTAHSGTSGIYFLSPDRLAQASLARFMGPSDYTSPRGASFQEPISTALEVRLPSYRNTWNLGYPLVKLTSDHLPSDAGMDKVEKLNWSSDVTYISGPVSYFDTEVASADLVTEYGEFYVDYYTGTITAYTTATSEIILQIDNLHMFGPGPAWGTSNIIPHWNDDATLCWVTINSTSGGTTLYDVALPQVQSTSRDTDPDAALLGAVYHPDIAIASVVQWNATVSGATAYYRLPVSLTNNLTAGDQIPDGFMYVWDESTGRIVPQTEFFYVDEHNVQVQTPEGWLTEGGSIRLIVTGTSLAEAVHHLMMVQREGRHAGLSTGQHQDTLHYMVPISHDEIVDSFSGPIGSTITEPTKFYFRESTAPVNPHPQYIHRAGYLDDDEEGNSANAMRGWLAFAGRYDIDSAYTIGAGTASGTMGATYGLIFGGGTITTSSQNARLAWEGGENVDTWSGSGDTAKKLGFGIDELGAQRVGSERFGALTYTPWYGMPLYLRGQVDTVLVEAVGAVLGFDFGDWGEMNYIKLTKAFRSGSWDMPNQACWIEQATTSALSITPGLIGGTTSNRLAAEQIREFRFRAGSYNPDTRNANDGLGNTTQPLTFDSSLSHDAIEANGASKYFVVDGECASDFRVGDTITCAGFSNSGNNDDFTITAVSQIGGNTHVSVSESVVTEPSPTSATVTSSTNEFNPYFTSPGMVGADFFNVYSNAIFFSDTGDGKTTSFTDRGNLWMNTGSSDSMPSGIYYVPQATQGPAMALSLYDSSLSASSQPLYVGDRYGFWYISEEDGPVGLITTDSVLISSGHDTGNLATIVSNIRTYGDSGQLGIAAGDYAAVQASYGLAGSSMGLQLYASDDYPDIRITSWHGDIAIRTYTSGYIAIDSTEYLTIDANDDININADNIYLDAKSYIFLDAPGINVTSEDYSVTINTNLDFIVNCGDEIEMEADGTGDNWLEATNGNLYLRSGTSFNSNAVLGLQATGRAYILADEIELLTNTTGSGDIAIKNRHGGNIELYCSGSGEVQSATIYGEVAASPRRAVYVSDSSSNYTVATTSSSKKYKTDISSLEEPPTWLYDLNPVSFRFKKNKKYLEWGLIAEEVHEVLKAAEVSDNAMVLYEDGKPDGILYDQLIPLLLSAVKDLKTRLDKLEG
jgi:hypothetical protein